MRKSLLLVITILLHLSGFAQKVSSAHIVQPLHTVYTNDAIPVYSSLGRTTSVGDTVALSNIAGDSVFVLYMEGTNDSNGYLTGTDSSNDQAFAERYNIDGADSSVNVIGVLAQFGGTVNPASNLAVTFTVWDQSVPVVISATQSYNGFPNDILDTLTVPATSLGISATGNDTLKLYLFEQPTGTLQYDFFVGYSINYIFDTLSGDTIGLATTVNGSRTSNVATAVENTTTFATPFGDTTITVLDTVINVQNATMGSDNNWYDNYTQDDSILNDLVIFPVVSINNATGVKGISKNNLTFFGNYPNPATDNTNIKFSLAAAADVSIQIMDMAGRTLNTIDLKNSGIGEHIVPVNTSGMAAGNYLYLIRTSAGAGMAGELTVIK